MELKRDYAKNNAVLSLFERSGRVLDFHVNGSSSKRLLPIRKANFAAESHIITDDAGLDAHRKKHFAGMMS